MTFFLWEEEHTGELFNQFNLILLKRMFFQISIKVNHAFWLSPRTKTITVIVEVIFLWLEANYNLNHNLWKSDCKRKRKNSNLLRAEVKILSILLLNTKGKLRGWKQLINLRSIIYRSVLISKLQRIVLLETCLWKNQGS